MRQESNGSWAASAIERAQVRIAMGAARAAILAESEHRAAMRALQEKNRRLRAKLHDVKRALAAAQAELARRDAVMVAIHQKGRMVYLCLKGVLHAVCDTLLEQSAVLQLLTHDPDVLRGHALRLCGQVDGIEIKVVFVKGPWWNSAQHRTVNTDFLDKAGVNDVTATYAVLLRGYPHIVQDGTTLFLRPPATVAQSRTTAESSAATANLAIRSFA